MLSLSYNGSTQQPTIQQIQPVPENNDPLNVFIGNPDISPAFNHRFFMFFNDYKVLKERGMYVNASFNLTDNTITNSNTVDKQGRREYKSVNAGTTYNYWSYMGYNMKIAPIKTRVGLNLQANGSRFTNFVNEVQNITNNTNYGLGLNTYYSIDNKLGISLRGNVNYNTAVSSIREDVKTRYWTQSYNADIYIALPYKFDFNTDADFNVRQATSVFDQNRNVLLWNASISKRLLKEKCNLKFSINDMLNQNIGFRRDIQSNFITENTYATLRRFWLVSFTWNFSKNNAQAKN